MAVDLEVGQHILFFNWVAIKMNKAELKENIWLEIFTSAVVSDLLTSMSGFGRYFNKSSVLRGAPVSFSFKAVLSAAPLATVVSF